jgi:hypothetical protein
VKLKTLLLFSILISFALLFISGCTTTQRGASSDNLYQNNNQQKVSNSFFSKKEKSKSIEVLELTYEEAVGVMHDVSISWSCRAVRLVLWG